MRVDEANRVRQDRQARKAIKGARWLLLRNRENVRAEDRVTLREVLATNRRLATVYVLKDDLKHLWEYTYPGAARRFWAAARSGGRGPRGRGPPGPQRPERPRADP